MNLDYTIKTATEEQIFSHLHGCNDSFITPLNERVELHEYSKKIFDKSMTFEAWENKFLVGLVSAYFNDNENSFGYITNVSTTKKFTGKGIASILLKNCIEYAKQHNFAKFLQSRESY